MPDPILGTGDVAMTKTDKVPAPRSLHSIREDHEYIYVNIQPGHSESHKKNKVGYGSGK